MDDAIEAAGNRLTLLADMEKMLDLLFSDLASARREVAIDCYIVLDDRLGRALGERLVAAVRRGVRARLMYDPLGSKEAHRRFFRSLQAQGVEVRGWRRLNSIPALRHLAPRNHSRIFLADGAAYTGGAAFSDCWLPRSRGGGGWHDVCCRAQGPIVGHFWRLFEQRWDQAEPDSHDPTDYDSGGPRSPVRLVADTPDRRSPLFHLHCEAFARARRRIWIENAYFVPPPSMERTLRAAARRGVDVRVILPAVSDLVT
ncbi:MAG TPA: phospholipase D-like domain-containing protein, partial [Thermoanaerobaculia bacterium]